MEPSLRSHDIGAWPRNATHLRSDGRGWRNVHAALITVDAWSGTLAPVGNPCLGYCVSQPAQISRRVSCGPSESGMLRPRQFHLIPALEQSEWDRRGRSEMLTLTVRQELLDATARQLGSEHVSRVELELSLGTVDPLLEQLALSVLEALKDTHDASSALFADTLAHAMAVHLLRTYTAAGRTARRKDDLEGDDIAGMRHVRDFIQENLAEDLSLDVLAAAAGVSTRSLSRAFARRFGTSVHRYVLDRRLDKAKQLLLSTDLGIVEIALEVGFSSQSHLAMAFRKAIGVTPGSFRTGRR